MFSIWLLDMSSSFQGTKTSRSWIKRLWCSGHTGTTKASTSTKLLNFTTKLLKLSWRNPPKSPARWVPMVSSAGWRWGTRKNTQVLWCSLWTFFLEGIVPMAGKISSKASNVYIFEKKKQNILRVTAGWPGIIKISSFNPKKNNNWQSTPNIGMSSNPQRVLSRRYGTVLACNYQTPTVREDSLSRVRKRTHEKRYHNLKPTNGDGFLLRFFDGFEQKNNYIVLAAFPISEMQVKKIEITEATKVAWSIGQAIHVFSSDSCNFFSNRVMATLLEWSLESWYIT